MGLVAAGFRLEANAVPQPLQGNVVVSDRYPCKGIDGLQKVFGLAEVSQYGDS